MVLKRLLFGKSDFESSFTNCFGFAMQCNSRELRPSYRQRTRGPESISGRFRTIQLQFQRSTRCIGHSAQMGSDTTTTITTPSASAVFRMSLWRQGLHVGWLGENSTEWAVLVADIRQALLLEPCPYNGSVYYQVSGSLRYLALSPDACIGFYNWANASGFTREGRHLVADDTGQKLALQSAERNDLCAWNGCRVLEVGFEPVGAAVGAR